MHVAQLVTRILCTLAQRLPFPAVSFSVPARTRFSTSTLVSLHFNFTDLPSRSLLILQQFVGFCRSFLLYTYA